MTLQDQFFIAELGKLQKQAQDLQQIKKRLELLMPLLDTAVIITNEEGLRPCND